MQFFFSIKLNSMEGDKTFDDCFEDEAFMKKYTQMKLIQSFKLKEYTKEDELIELCKEKTMAIHFFHPNFSICKNLNNSFQAISTKFAKEKVGYLIGCINVENCRKMVSSIGISVLPVVCFFKDGFLIEKMTGFENLEKSKNGNLRVDELEAYIRKVLSTHIDEKAEQYA